MNSITPITPAAPRSTTTRLLMKFIMILIKDNMALRRALDEARQ